MSGVSMPDEPSAKKIRLQLKEEVASGQLDIGENIVGREYVKRVYDKSTKQVITKTFTVFGRKQKLDRIRIKCYQKCKQYMRLFSDEHIQNLSQNETIKELE